MLDNELETFIIFDNKCKLIILSMDWYSYYTKNNKIEITYRQEDEEGWGAGGNEFFTSEDLKGMANCIRSVMNHEKASNHYECWEDTFRIKLKFNEKSKRYSLTVALIETLCKEYHITITKSGLCEKTLMKYLTPFFEWEKRYPIIMAEKEKIERERELKHNNEKY